jgi:periplasmic protein TonB
MEEAYKKKQGKRLLKKMSMLAVFLGLASSVLLVIWLKNWINENDVTQPKRVQKITIITSPPPPPPPPEEQPPEPEVEEEIEHIEEEVVEEMPDEIAEPAADLGVDAEGGAGSDGFGLIGRKGGRGLLDGSPFVYYEGLMVSEIQDVLSEIDDLKFDEYRFRIKIKVAFDGSVISVSLVKSTGDKEKDKILLSALKSVNKFSQMPPGKMPPVVDLRITSSI